MSHEEAAPVERRQSNAAKPLLNLAPFAAAVIVAILLAPLVLVATAQMGLVINEGLRHRSIGIGRLLLGSFFVYCTLVLLGLPAWLLSAISFGICAGLFRWADRLNWISCGLLGAIHGAVAVAVFYVAVASDWMPPDSGAITILRAITESTPLGYGTFALFAISGLLTGLIIHAVIFRPFARWTAITAP